MKSAILIILPLVLTNMVSIKQASVSKSTSYKQDNDTLIKKNNEAELNRLRLLKIEDSTAVSQIRVWIIATGPVDSGRVIIFKKNESKYTGEYHSYRFDWDVHKKDSLISHKLKVSSPISGWNNFFKKINQIGIYKLDDEKNSSDHELATHCGGIVVEIIESNEYKRFIYPCWYFSNYQKNIKKVMILLKETEKQFNFKIFPLDKIEPKPKIIKAKVSPVIMSN
jgi:hypothetical protein